MSSHYRGFRQFSAGVNVYPGIDSSLSFFFHESLIASYSIGRRKYGWVTLTDPFRLLFIIFAEHSE